MNTHQNHELPAITIIGVARTFYLHSATVQNEIGQFLHYFFANQILNKIPNKIDDYTMHGIYTDYDTQGNYSLIIGAPANNTQDIPEGMISSTIPAANYAVFAAKGPFAPSVANAWVTIWKTTLNRTFTYDFEVYDANSTNDEKSTVNIYIAVK